jgi:hypothetical protein
MKKFLASFLVCSLLFVGGCKDTVDVDVHDCKCAKSKVETPPVVPSGGGNHPVTLKECKCGLKDCTQGKSLCKCKAADCVCPK